MCRCSRADLLDDWREGRLTAEEKRQLKMPEGSVLIWVVPDPNAIACLSTRATQQPANGLTVAHTVS
jgi:hypothetical protein